MGTKHLELLLLTVDCAVHYYCSKKAKKLLWNHALRQRGRYLMRSELKVYTAAYKSETMKP